METVPFWKKCMSDTDKNIFYLKGKRNLDIKKKILDKISKPTNIQFLSSTGKSTFTQFKVSQTTQP